ncbi:hypothetical protein HYH03_001971 [Edaphochlamys debaryana]|uniref:BTB domain-containing protein n=1 Tax=Edaphochlamys debaryana TaxID=47281 RepID=A0A835YCJ0_9CHLO|nr:hypothetical protein HYH03_001971 [Edaphochlamys debaryana]|eukprot:KAG2500400.1 hypothetical protein HYH03_001971 [Edaphochlamys debaryana]
MQVLSCRYSLAGQIAGVLTRLRPDVSLADGDEPEAETLACTFSAGWFPVIGVDGHSGLSLGPPLSLHEVVQAPGRDATDARPLDDRDVRFPTFDSFTASAWACVGHSVARLTGEHGDTLETVVGDPDEQGVGDGLGTEARLINPCFLCSDGKGSLYCRTGEGGRCVARLQLPASWRSCAPTEPPTPDPSSAASRPVPAASSPAAASASAAPPCAAAAAAAAQAHAGVPTDRVRVTTLRFHAPSEIWGMALAPPTGPDGGDALIVATGTALYRLPLHPTGSAAAGAQLLAGQEGARGRVDGQGGEARFTQLCGLAVDEAGALYAADWWGPTSAVRRVRTDGAVTTVAEGMEGGFARPVILSNGYLALCGLLEPVMLVLDLGLKPTPLLPPAAPVPAGPPRRTLHADMGALLDAQPDGTADLTLVVGGRRFAVHRAILIARCDYFRQRLEGGFADGAAAELSLPDADPAAFELLLRFIYTGSAPIPPALAPAVAELADRLLLPELCLDAQAAVLSGVSADSVVDLMLWAERRGPAFKGLLPDLKSWYVDHHEQVAEAAEDSLARLSESPALAVELVRRLSRRALGRDGSQRKA